MNLRTAETVFINWLQPEAMEPNMTVNWHTRTLAYKHRDGRYYLNKFNVDWDLIVRQSFKALTTKKNFLFRAQYR
jgi:hypothetical protein